MKKIINGRKYDTETARKLCEWVNSDGYVEAIYRKESGEFFWWAEYSPRKGCEVIAPMRAGIAIGYCEAYMDADEYEAEFGEVEE